MNQVERLYGSKATFWAVFLLITGVLLIGSLWVINFVRATVVEAAEEQTETTAQYINYLADGSYISDESNAAIAEYIAQYPEPQNVQVLVGLQTSQVWAYMTTYLSGGMQQDCTYCHNLSNFSLYEDPDDPDAEWQERKATALIHLQMTQDLNVNWIGTLADLVDEDGNPVDKQPSGAHIICATCHNGEPQPETWAANQHSIPDDYRLPLDDIDGRLLLQGRQGELSLDAVAYNQATMYHFNESLQVGCTHCHNSRYFPSWEQPAKYYAYHMLQMNQHIQAEYGDTFNDKETSCVMCHQNAVRPPGAAVNAEVLPPPLRADYEIPEPAALSIKPSGQ